jgi:ribosomal protein S18 acetylase RimI-like enzyme
MSGPDPGAELLAPDPWLAEALGVPTFSLHAPLRDPAAVRASLERRAAVGDAFVFAKVPLADIETVWILEACGFNVIETQMTFEYTHGTPATTDAIDIRSARPDDRDAVSEIAGTCFRYSRFHQDPRIGDERAHRVKRRWAENCLDGGRGEEMLVAIQGGLPTGFLTVLVASENRKSIAVIDLVGVAAGSQRRGVGAALVNAFISRWRGRSDVLRVGTQAANAESIRMYERCGFRFCRASYVLHVHLKGEPVA